MCLFRNTEASSVFLKQITETMLLSLLCLLDHLKCVQFVDKAKTSHRSRSREREREKEVLHLATLPSKKKKRRRNPLLSFVLLFTSLFFFLTVFFFIAGLKKKKNNTARSLFPCATNVVGSLPTAESQRGTEKVIFP